MWPYAVCFAVSCYFTSVATKYKNHDRKIEYIFFSFLAVILPCLLAALRDSSVGTDVSVYGDSIFYNSIHMNFGDYITSRNGDYLYLFIVYLCSHTVGTLQCQYFVLQAMTIIPIYCAIQRFSENRYAWYGMIVYYLVLFPYSFNLMRQCIAIAILFWGFKYVQNRKLIKYLVIVFIASLFHSTAVIGIAIYPIYILMSIDMDELTDSAWYSRHSKSLILNIAIKYGRIISWIIIILTVLILTQFSKIINFLYLYSADDYVYFYNSLGTTSAKYPFIVGYVVLMLPIFCLYFLNRRYYNESDGDVLPLFTLSMIGFVLYQAATISSETYRVALYFNIFLPVFVMKLLYYRSKIQERRLMMAIIFACLILFWYRFFMIGEWCHIYPYTSDILGIK